MFVNRIKKGKNNAGVILIFLQYNAIVSEKCMQILLTTRSRMYENDKRGNILGTHTQCVFGAVSFRLIKCRVIEERHMVSLSNV